MDTLAPERLWQPYVGGRSLELTGPIAAVRNPATGQPAGRVAVGGRQEADAAVRAAAGAFEEWARLERDERLAILRKVASALDQRAEEMAQVICAEVGTPIKLARRIQVGLPQIVLAATLDLVEGSSFEEEVGNSLVVREPIGVVAAITPWNYPLHQAMCKIAPALAVGCTVVLKPASATPLNALLLAEAADAAGLPAGVLNVVTGSGREVGDRLVSHPDVDMVTFTGSTEAGRRVGVLAAQTIKKVSLELGGKSACVILDDADVAAAVTAAVRNGLLNSGQTCSAWTRLIVPASRRDEAYQAAAETAAAMRVGDPTDENTQLGPLISTAHRQIVMQYVQTARDEGARELYTGSLDDDLDGGSFLAPHIFGEVRPEHRIAQEEIFGPVLAVMPAADEQHAVEIANSTIYGLAGGVFSADPERAMRVARKLRTGQVDVNGGAFNPNAPFGGYRQSGVGRELGRYGVEEFLEVKAIQR
jgi:aldehyde dehydrogenase (NAD+)